MNTLPESIPEPVQIPDGDLLRAGILKVAVIAALIVGLSLSWRLWLPDRLFPLSPVSDSLPVIPAWLGELWLWSLIALLIVAALLPRPAIALGPALILAIALPLWDQSRLQPWYYLYLAMLVCLFCFPWNDSEKGEQRRRVLNACRLIVAGTYFWSGIQKFNISFATDVFPWLITPLVPESARNLAERGALLAPVIETALGIGLLIPAFRGLCILGALAMHAGILYCLAGPESWGCHHWNSVVWPWNGAMMVFVLTLFVRTRTVTPLALLWPGRSVLQWAMLLLFGLMPIFNFFGYWDAYLSASLYSGNTMKAEFLLPESAYRRLPEAVRRHAYETFDRKYSLEVFLWSIEELNVPTYPAERVFRSILRHLQGFCDPADQVELILLHPPHWLSGKRAETMNDER